jgi:flagellin-like protein
MFRRAKWFNKNRKGISEIIGYVLMIALAVVMAGLVYSWLKFYVSKPVSEQFCPDGTSLIVSDYNCTDKIVSLTLRNQGRFTIDGMIARISNKSGSEIAVYPLTQSIYNEFGIEIKLTKISFVPALEPGNETTELFNYSDYGNIQFLEVEPSKGTDKYGNVILCDNAIIKFPISNCG